VKEASILAGRRLAILESGQIVLVPPTAQVGDVVYQLDISLGNDYKSAFVFRPLDREVANKSLRRLSVSQLQAFDHFRFHVLHSEGLGPASEEYQHGLLLGQARVFDDGVQLERNWRSADTQLLVIH
jgi:hypothetical protein